MTITSFQMKIISDCWRHIVLKDMEPDNIQRRPREGTNIEIQRQIVTDKKNAVTSDVIKPVIEINEDHSITDNEPNVDVTLQNVNLSNQNDDNIQYL